MKPMSARNPNSSHCFREDILAIYDDEFAADMDHNDRGDTLAQQRMIVDAHHTNAPVPARLHRWTQ